MVALEEGGRFFASAGLGERANTVQISPTATPPGQPQGLPLQWYEQAHEAEGRASYHCRGTHKGVPNMHQAKGGPGGDSPLAGCGVSPHTSFIMYCRLGRQDKGCAEGCPLLSLMHIGETPGLIRRTNEREE